MGSPFIFDCRVLKVGCDMSNFIWFVNNAAESISIYHGLLIS